MAAPSKEELQQLIDRINELDQEDRAQFDALVKIILETMLKKDKYFRRNLKLIKKEE